MIVAAAALAGSAAPSHASSRRSCSVVMRAGTPSMVSRASSACADIASARATRLLTASTWAWHRSAARASGPLTPSFSLALRSRTRAKVILSTGSDVESRNRAMYSMRVASTTTSRSSFGMRSSALETSNAAPRGPASTALWIAMRAPARRTISVLARVSENHATSGSTIGSTPARRSADCLARPLSSATANATMNTAGTASSSVPNPVMKAATTARAINPSATRYLTALFALEQIQSSVPRSCSDVSPIRSLWNQFLFDHRSPLPQVE